MICKVLQHGTWPELSLPKEPLVLNSGFCCLFVVMFCLGFFPRENPMLPLPFAHGPVLFADFSPSPSQN